MSAGQHVFATLAGMSGESRDGVTLDCRRCAYVSDSVCVLKNIVDKNLSAWYRELFSQSAQEMAVAPL